MAVAAMTHSTVRKGMTTWKADQAPILIRLIQAMGLIQCSMPMVWVLFDSVALLPRVEAGLLTARIG